MDINNLLVLRQDFYQNVDSVDNGRLIISESPQMFQKYSKIMSLESVIHTFQSCKEYYDNFARTNWRYENKKKKWSEFYVFKQNRQTLSQYELDELKEEIFLRLNFDVDDNSLKQWCDECEVYYKSDYNFHECQYGSS